MLVSSEKSLSTESHARARGIVCVMLGKQNKVNYFKSYPLSVNSLHNLTESKHRITPNNFT